MLDLNDVAIFVHIVETGSFAGAARRLGMPPNTLSRRIKQLEASLSVRLFHRSTRKLTLTGAGQRLYEHSAQKISELNAISTQLVAENQAPAGRVKVAAPADFFDLFLMEWVADFLALYPGVHLDFVLSDTHADVIGEGIDVAFRGGHLKDSSLVARKISTGRRLLAASQSYLNTSGVPEDIHALQQHACITHCHASARTVWHLMGPEGGVQVDVSGRFSANTAQAQLKAAQNGLGICFLPESLLYDSIRRQQLIAVLPDYGQMNNDLSIVYPSRHHIPLAVATFVEHTVALLQKTILQKHALHAAGKG
ncbi:LysR family transcriptional regulator [Erwinia persicina]|uniref:LysR family transcriptional regulator n=1 Tax=Erwinia persicina TaxID=55211 RepID=UPI001783A891|nr:LysR family transcriptional regulator [Erwinia persicina]MBD8163515.1 LysR family transcriptional regulator [Erwinia persicina]